MALKIEYIWEFFKELDYCTALGMVSTAFVIAKFKP